MVRDIDPGPAASLPSSLTVVDGLLYFTAVQFGTGRQVWRSDGTEAGTVRLTGELPGVGELATFAKKDNYVYFAAPHPAAGFELCAPTERRRARCSSRTSTRRNSRPGADATGRTKDFTLLPALFLPFTLRRSGFILRFRAFLQPLVQPGGDRLLLLADDEAGDLGEGAQSRGRRTRPGRPSSAPCSAPPSPRR